MKIIFKTITALMMILAIANLTACRLEQNSVNHCVPPTKLYASADKRQIDGLLFTPALACSESETVNLALIALGRIGGEQASNLIATKLNDADVSVRKTAAFAAGISTHAAISPKLFEQLQSEKNPSVQKQLGLAIGTLGHVSAVSELTKLIENAGNDYAAKGAMQGLSILALFHRERVKDTGKIPTAKVIKYLKNPTTQLEASFLLARIALLRASDRERVEAILPSLNNDAKALTLRALARLGSNKSLPLFLNQAQSRDLGTRLSALQGLAKLDIKDAEQVDRISSVVNHREVNDSVVALQSVGIWLEQDLLEGLLKSENSWQQSEAYLALLKRDLIKNTDIASAWTGSGNPNLQRAAIKYYQKQNYDKHLKILAEHAAPIISNGAKQALKISEPEDNQPLVTPEQLPKLPAQVKLKTTRGDIVIKLFADTPYTSANFISLSKSGFYDGTYFHRVIPNFVAQGGSKNGDGSGTVGHMIREELSMRSHRFGTVGMATAGKDTGGGQFFFNLAPNLHLDNNYTIFGEVVEGLELLEKLEQNDKIIKATVL